MTEQKPWTAAMTAEVGMSKTWCDLRVLLRFNDGTIGVYAIDGIPSAARMREELACAGEAYSDAGAADDCLPEDQYPSCVGDVFREMRAFVNQSGAQAETAQEAPA